MLQVCIREEACERFAINSWSVSVHNAHVCRDAMITAPCNNELLYNQTEESSQGYTNCDGNREREDTKHGGTERVEGWGGGGAEEC